MGANNLPDRISFDKVTSGMETLVDKASEISGGFDTAITEFFNDLSQMWASKNARSFYIASRLLICSTSEAMRMTFNALINSLCDVASTWATTLSKSDSSISFTDSFERFSEDKLEIAELVESIDGEFGINTIGVPILLEKTLRSLKNVEENVTGILSIDFGLEDKKDELKTSIKNSFDSMCKYVQQCIKHISDGLTKALNSEVENLKLGVEVAKKLVIQKAVVTGIDAVVGINATPDPAVEEVTTTSETQ